MVFAAFPPPVIPDISACIAELFKSLDGPFGPRENILLPVTAENEFITVQFFTSSEPLEYV